MAEKEKYPVGWFVLKEKKDGKVVRVAICDDDTGPGDVAETFWYNCDENVESIEMEWCGNPGDLARAIEKNPRTSPQREGVLSVRREHCQLTCIAD